MSREQWGNGYFKGLQDGMKSLVSLYDYITLKYKDENSPFGDLARDMISDFEVSKRCYGTATENETKSACVYHARFCGNTKYTLYELEKEWKRLRK